MKGLVGEGSENVNYIAKKLFFLNGEESGQVLKVSKKNHYTFVL